MALEKLEFNSRQGQENFFLLYSSQTGPRVHPAYKPMDTVGLFSASNAAGADVKNSGAIAPLLNASSWQSA
jgi:hypothetical protein